MTPSKLQVTADLAHAAALLFEHHVITEEQGQAICRGIFNVEPQESAYDPIYYVMLDDKEFWSISGWHGEALACGPENGAEVIDFVKARPKYNAICRLEKPGGWCICCRRGLQEVAMPRQGSKPTETAPKDQAPPESKPEAPTGPMGGKKAKTKKGDDDCPFLG